MKQGTSLDFTLTLSCNNACRFCPRGALQPILTTPARALAAIRAAGGCGEAVLTGGEPTVLKKLAAIAAACRAAGARRVRLITNGRALADPALLERLRAAGVTSLTFSVYSHLPRTHDGLTRTPGSCAQTWKGLRNALRLYGEREVSVNMVLCAENISAAATTLRMLKVLGAATVTLINPVGPLPAGLFSYARLSTLLRRLGRRPGDYPARLLFRGFPLCLFPEGAAAENQDIDGAGGVPGGRLRAYGRDFGSQFAKPAGLCAGCSKAARCNGVTAAYLARYRLAGLR
jgi:molybdenum cofactor biosynthesis enzyme MoaA